MMMMIHFHASDLLAINPKSPGRPDDDRRLPAQSRRGLGMGDDAEDVARSSRMTEEDQAVRWTSHHPSRRAGRTR